MTTAASALLPERLPEVGELVQVRSRRWIVEGLTESGVPGESARVLPAGVDDDKAGRALEVLWDCRPDRWILSAVGEERIYSVLLTMLTVWVLSLSDSTLMV